MNRIEIDFFTIDGRYYGGDQHWGRSFLMRLGGCSTVTACEQVICLARLHEKARALYSHDPFRVTKAQFIELFDEMFRFVRPGTAGLTDISKYARGIERYAQSRNVLLMPEMLPGEDTLSAAADFIRGSLEHGRPVAYLMLKHCDCAFDEYEWHWFTVTGDERCATGHLLTVATYGQKHRLDLSSAWNTGYSRKGGLVSMTLPR